MAVITSNTESWNGHSFQEVETFIKNKILYNDHDYVEIGDLKWATKNIGAGRVCDYGDYFQWGDIRGYSYNDIKGIIGQNNFNVEDYKYSYTYENTEYANKYCENDNLTTLELDDDAARVIWVANGESQRLLIFMHCFQQQH